MARAKTLLLLLGFLASLAAAASPPTFCKCTCFTNSTIIPLGPGHEPPAPPSKGPDNQPAPPADEPSSSSTTSLSTAAATASVSRRGPTSESSNLLDERAASSSCSQCNRAFCLQYNLPICKGAEEKDVVTQCFARDSRKDQIIVWTFLLGTGGLLGWAAAKRAIEYRDRKAAAASGTGLGSRGSGGIGGIAATAARGVGASSRSPGLGNLRSPRRDPTDTANRGDYLAVGEDQLGDTSGRGPLG